jgi:hypothetical protein
MAFGSLGYVQSGTYGTTKFISTAPSWSQTTGSQFPTYKSLIMWLHDTTNSGTPTYFGWQETVDKYIPIGARLVLVQFTIRAFDTIWTTPINPPAGFDSEIIMFLNTYVSPAIYVNPSYIDSWFTTGTPSSAQRDQGILNDNVTELSAPNINVTGGQVNSSFGSFTGVIDLTNYGGNDISTQYVSGQGSGFGCSLAVRYQANASNPIDIYLTPIFFKYRW